MTLKYFDKIKFFNRSYFYKMGDYKTMKNLLKWQKDKN